MGGFGKRSNTGSALRAYVSFINVNAAAIKTYLTTAKIQIAVVKKK